VEAEPAGWRVSKSGIVAAATSELSVGLCHGNHHMCRAWLGLLAGVLGSGFRAGAAGLGATDDVMQL
jgi:hypothetical protein